MADKFLILFNLVWINFSHLSKILITFKKVNTKMIFYHFKIFSWVAQMKLWRVFPLKNFPASLLIKSLLVNDDEILNIVFSKVLLLN